MNSERQISENLVKLKLMCFPNSFEEKLTFSNFKFLLILVLTQYSSIRVKPHLAVMGHIYIIEVDWLIENSVSISARFSLRNFYYSMSTLT